MRLHETRPATPLFIGEKQMVAYQIAYSSYERKTVKVTNYSCLSHYFIIISVQWSNISNQKITKISDRFQRNILFLKNIRIKC